MVGYSYIVQNYFSLINILTLTTFSLFDASNSLKTQNEGIAIMRYDVQYRQIVAGSMERTIAEWSAEQRALLWDDLFLLSTPCVSLTLFDD